MIIDTDILIDYFRGKKQAQKHSLSYGLKMVDALIAAIAINYDEELITGNYKDFKFIKEINVKKYDDPESVRI